jgi:trigger factor
LEFQVQEVGEWVRRLTVSVPAEKVERQWEEILAAYRRRAALPGFRKGKVPTEMVRRQYQGDIESDLKDELIPEAIEEVLREQQIVPAVPVQIKDVRLALGQPLTFVAEVVARPRFDVTGYRGLQVEQEITDVDDSMLDEAMEIMRRNRANLIPVDRPSADGDVVKATLEPIDVSGNRMRGAKKEEIRLDVGSPTLLPEFRETTLGISRGEERQVQVEYPAEFRDKDLAGKTRRFRLQAQEILEKKLPELDDNFAKGIDPNLDLDGLKGKLRVRLESEELMHSMEGLETNLIDRLLAQNPFTVPDVMIDYSLRRILEKAREDGEEVEENEFRERYRPIVERMHSRDLLFENLTRQESLELTEEELDTQLDAMAQDAGVDVSVIKKKMEEEGELTRMRDTMQERKVLDFLAAAAQVTRIRKPRLRPEGSGKSRIIVP